MIKRHSFAAKVIDFNNNLKYNGAIPEAFKVLNPYLDNPETMIVMHQFYEKYYNDNRKRKFIIGINPSRHGAGVTGVPFTDTKRLETVCGITLQSAHTHEVSSVFLYDMIKQYGGADKFYGNFYINSPFPLAIVRKAKDDNFLNANYYDDSRLFDCVKEFMIDSLKRHFNMGLDTDEVFVLGVKNGSFIKKLNDNHRFFKKMTILEHPRFIQQYKSKEKQLFIDKYIEALKGEESATKKRE